MKIGLIARADMTGLGNQSQDWVRNLPIDKILIAWGSQSFDPEIYKDQEVTVCEQGTPSILELTEFVKDLDILLAIETPYNWNAFSIAKKAGVKTILAPNYEWIPTEMPEEPDLYLCYSTLTMDYVPEPKVYLQQPINREILGFKLRTQAKTFLFNNGNGGVFGRNSLSEFVQAIPLVKSDVKFIINSQIPFDTINDSRVVAKIGNQPINEIWKEGDVFVHLRKFGANSLPIYEAMSLGMPVLGVKRKPEIEFLPEKFLVDPEGEIPVRCRDDLKTVRAKIVSPIKIAEKIDELANIDITEYSKLMDKRAEEWSWDNWRDKWIKSFKDLMGGE